MRRCGQKKSPHGAGPSGLKFKEETPKEGL